MTDAEERLERLLKDDATPSRDPAFRIELLARLERRRIRRQFELLAAVAVLGGLALWRSAPALTPWLAGSSEIIAALAAAAALIWSSLVLVDKGVRA